MTTRILAATLLLVIATMATAKGDIEAGKNTAKTCQACHGEDGNGVGNDQYPVLAGQYADYMVKALKDYKSGVRNNAIMLGFASALSEQDMENVAAFFASQPSQLHDLSQSK